MAAPSPAPAPRPLEVDGCNELARIERSGLIESRHLGAAAVVDSTGQVVRAVGDVEATMFPRSALKPLQAIAMLELGARFTDAELVLATASHCGSPEHLAVVEGMLRADGRDATALQCPVQPPLGAADRAARAARGLAPTQVTMNCSGKHAGMLRASDAVGSDPARYLEPDHPVQRAVVSVIERFTDASPHLSGLDGCGAPLHATSLRELALATARVAEGRTAEAARLVRAVGAEPWAIDGHGRANTLTIERLGGIAKLGAEGVVVIGTPAGVAVSVKVLDGSMRATTPVALHLLASVGAIDPDAAAELTERTSETVLAGDRPVGALRVSLD
jgi:L-asparaginase II